MKVRPIRNIGLLPKKAEKDGFANIAKLFRTTAEAERIHAEGHLKALDMIATTAENLQAAIDGETYEFTEMYPPMVELAVADGHKAKTMFKFAVDAEAVHAKIYAQALEAVKKGVDLDVSEFYLCPVCGYIELSALKTSGVRREKRLFLKNSRNYPPSSAARPLWISVQ